MNNKTNNYDTWENKKICVNRIYNMIKIIKAIEHNKTVMEEADILVIHYMDKYQDAEIINYIDNDEDIINFLNNRILQQVELLFSEYFDENKGKY